MNKTVTTHSYEETQSEGEALAQQLSGGSVVLLYGDLGSGKTTFVQGLAKGLGIDRRIISPTFVIVRRYALERKSQSAKGKTTAQNAKHFYHIDLYRTQTWDDLKGLGIDEVVRDQESVVAIEWPEKLGELLPGKRIEVHCAYKNETDREMQIQTHH